MTLIETYSMPNEFQASLLQFFLRSFHAKEVDLSLQLQYVPEVRRSHRRSAEYILLSDTLKAEIVEFLEVLLS